MLKLKKIVAVVTTCLLVLSLSACLPKENTEKSSKETLNIGAINSIDVLPIVIANEKGFFEKNDVKVNFQPFKSAKDRDTAFQSENLDGIICDLIAICLYQNADFDVKITGITDGDFMLIASAKSGIKTVSDIKGASVAISEKTAIEYTLDRILENNSLAPKDVEKTMVPAVPTRLEMLRNNKVDAALLPEPFATMALDDGGVLLGSANTLASYPSLTAFTQKSIEEKSSQIKAFYKAYNEAVDYINATAISEYEAIVMSTVGYPEEMKGKITLPEFRKNILPLIDEVMSAIEWTKNNEIVKKTLNPEDLISDIGVK